MGRHKVVHVDIGALFDAKVTTVAKVPGGGVTDHVALARFLQHRTFPESLRHRFHAQRDEELIGLLKHARRVVILTSQSRADVDALFVAEGSRAVVQAAPALRPHVAQQVSRNGPVQRHHLVAVLAVQFPSDVSVQLLVQRSHSVPQIVELSAQVFDVVR